MAYITLGEAAKLVGKSKPTLSKAIKSGKMSAIGKDENGYWQIDPAEAKRAFPDKSETSKSLQDDTVKKTKVNTEETQLLAVALEDLRRRLDDAEERAAKAEERLEKSHQDAREEREKLMLLLQYQPEDQPHTHEKSKRKGLLSRLF